MWSRRHETCARLRHQIHTAIGSPDRRGGAQHVGEYHIEPLRPVRGAAADIYLRGASLSEVETRTGSTGLDDGHDAVVVIAVHTVRRSWPSTKAVTAGY